MLHSLGSLYIPILCITGGAPQPVPVSPPPLVVPSIAPNLSPAFAPQGDFLMTGLNLKDFYSGIVFVDQAKTIPFLYAVLHPEKIKHTSVHLVHL